jgi:hypothetical protein
MIGIHSSLYGYTFFFLKDILGWMHMSSSMYIYIYIYIYIQESCVRVLYILTKLSSMAYNFAPDFFLLIKKNA